MSGPPQSRPVERPSPTAAAAAAPASRNTGAGSSSPSLTNTMQTRSNSGPESPLWHTQMPLVTRELRTLNGIVQAEVQRQRREQQASSSAAEGTQGGHVAPSQRLRERNNMEMINDLCYEIQVLFPFIVSNYPLAGPRPTAPLIEGHGTDTISTVYASRIETILRRYAGQPRMLESFQQQLEAVLLVHSHDPAVNAPHEDLITELRQLIAEERQRQRQDARSGYQSSPSPIARGPTDVPRAARDIEPAHRGETAAIREMIRDFGATGWGRDEADVRPSTIGRHLDIPSYGTLGVTAVQRWDGSIESPPRSGGGRSREESNTGQWHTVGFSRAEIEQRRRQTGLEMRRDWRDESPSSHDSSSGNDAEGLMPVGLLTAGEPTLRARLAAAMRGDRDQHDPFPEPLYWARVSRATTTPIGSRTAPSATRGHVGRLNHRHDAHVPSGGRHSGRAQNGNPQGHANGNGHTSPPSPRGRSGRP
jgi:hypothetical protein